MSDERMIEHWKITCREAHVLLSERMDRELAFGERLRLRAHLFICDVCSKVGKQMEFMRRAIKQLNG
jgi:hypothetical protein